MVKTDGDGEVESLDNVGSQICLRLSHSLGSRSPMEPLYPASALAL